jgi:leucyl aminopeptidase (aminopeptidase T)
MKNLEYCAKQAINCVRLKKGEVVVIIYDNAASNIAKSIYYEARKITDNIEKYLMENYGERPDNGENPLRFPEELKLPLQTADVSFFIKGEAKKGERESFHRPMLEVVESNKKLRHAHMPGVTEEVFLSGMSVDYDYIKEITERVNSLVKNARQIRVTTSKGTNFVADFSQNHRWVLGDGFPLPGKWLNLPDGETFTCPINLNGIIVVDGVLGDYFDQKYGLLDDNPLIIYAKNGRIEQAICPKNPDLEIEFNEYIRKEENANRFGEFAIGTNIGLEKLLGNMIHDEKFPGVHIAVGHPYPNETGADWDSDVHCDMVMRNCHIFIENKELMRNGKFTLI